MTRFLLDTTALIAHLRGEESITRSLLQALTEGHTVGTCCVNVAEVERGIRPRERKAVSTLLERLDYLDTSREAAIRAGQYQSTFAKRGVTIRTPDALIAGTARAHGAVLVTNNLEDFPMRDVRVEIASNE